MAEAKTENEPNQGGNEPGEKTPDAGGEFTPITSQDELNRIIGERVRRAKPADYDDLKVKAARLDEIEAANKSELEKANDAKASAELERDTARAEALRLRVAVKHGISDEDADLFLTGADEDTLTRQAERLAARNEDAGKPRRPAPDPNQGRSGGGPKSTADQFAAVLGAALNH